MRQALNVLPQVIDVVVLLHNCEWPCGQQLKWAVFSSAFSSDLCLFLYFK